MATKQKTHKLSTNHPILAALLYAYIGIFGIEILNGVINVPINRLIPAYPQECGIVGVLAAGLLALLYYRLHFKPEYEGFLKGGDLKTGFLLILFQVGYTLFVGVKDLLSGSVLHVPTVVSLSVALMAGFLEEIAFRGYLISTLMRKWKRDESKVLTAALISGAAFGLIHAMNITAGAPVGITIFQVIVTAMIGVFLAAVYLRSGNLLPVAAGHFFHDVISYVISDPDSSEQLIMSGSLEWSDLLEAAFAVVLAVIGICLLREEKRGEILAIWQKKWAAPAVTQESGNE